MLNKFCGSRILDVAARARECTNHDEYVSYALSEAGSYFTFLRS